MVAEKIKETKCSFCKKTSSYLNQYNYRVIKAPNLNFHICDNCAAKITLTSDLFDEKNSLKIKSKIDINEEISPQKIFNYLNQYVMHQDKAKKTLSLSAYQHFKRVSGDYRYDDVDVSKSNIMLIGQSGSGKTLLVDKMSEILTEIPFLSVNANSYTSEGYKGLSVNDMIRDLYFLSGEDIDATESGIIFIDEIDKIAGLNKDEGVNTINVQQSLLKIIEGTIVNLEEINVSINTRDILFICAGAFDSIEDTVKNRKNDSKIGFFNTNLDSSDNFDYSLIKHVDIKKYGFIDEFLGRFPILVPLEKFNVNQYYEMLTIPKNNLIDQIKLLFKEENSNIIFSDSSLLLLAEKSSALMLGARGAKTIFMPIIENVLFEISGKNTSYSVYVDNVDGEFSISFENTNN